MSDGCDSCVGTDRDDVVAKLCAECVQQEEEMLLQLRDRVEVLEAAIKAEATIEACKSGDDEVWIGGYPVGIRCLIARNERGVMTVKLDDKV